MVRQAQLEMPRHTSDRTLQLARRPVDALPRVGPMASRNATAVRAAAAAAAEWPRLVVGADTAVHPTRLDTVVAAAVALAPAAAAVCDMERPTAASVTAAVAAAVAAEVAAAVAAHAISHLAHLGAAVAGEGVVAKRVDWTESVGWAVGGVGQGARDAKEAAEPAPLAHVSRWVVLASAGSLQRAASMMPPSGLVAARKMLVARERVLLAKAVLENVAADAVHDPAPPTTPGHRRAACACRHETSWRVLHVSAVRVAGMLVAKGAPAVVRSAAEAAAAEAATAREAAVAVEVAAALKSELARQVAACLLAS